MWLKRRVLDYSMNMCHVIQKGELVSSKMKMFCVTEKEGISLGGGESESRFSTSSWKLQCKDAYYCKFVRAGGAYGSSVLMEWRTW